MNRFALFTVMTLIALAAVAVAAQSGQSPAVGQMPMQQGGMQGMSCCMMGGGPMGMSVMVTLTALFALLLLSASAAFIALAVFLLRRSRLQS